MRIQENQPEENAKSIAKWVQRAADEKAELIMFPELSISGGEHHSEPVPGPSTDQLISLADECSTMLCVGISERAGNTTYNTQVLVNGNGIIGKQRKLHLPSGEVSHRSAGSEVQAFSLGKAVVGIAICYDAFFPEVARSLYFKGAEIILMPFKESHSPSRDRVPEEAMYILAARVSCWANGCYGIVSNWAGTPHPHESHPKFGKWPGWAGIFDPHGVVVDFTCEDGNREAMIAATLDPNCVKKRRQDPEFTPNRLRPDIYCYSTL